MDSQNIIPGVGIGPMTDIYEIKILICYLLKSVGLPFSKNQINQVFQEDATVNYFSFCEAIKELLTSGHITAQTNNSEEVYSLNSLGEETATHLERSLPLSLRDNIVNTAMHMLAQMKLERENEVNILSYKNGFLVECVMHEENFDLLRLQVFAPDKIQAEKMKEKFMKDPIRIYKSFISTLLDEE